MSRFTTISLVLASLVLIGWPDEAQEKNLFAITIPDIGGLIDADGNRHAMASPWNVYPAAASPTRSRSP